jgi:NhaP-type Na+/H+ or K+/H+ antiporter
VQSDGLVLLGLVAIGYALVASRLERESVGGPLVFAAAGLLLGPFALSKLHPAADGVDVRLVAELTLALLLFADASTVGLRELRRHAGLPFRLLAVGLPLTIVFGTVVFHIVVPDATWGLAALAATILAPTDAALSLPVVTNRDVPSLVRTTLNVESGLNDGIASPVVTVLIAVVASEESPGQHWVVDAGRALGIALVVAFILGGGAGWLAALAHRRGLTTQLSDQLLVLMFALVSFGGAVWLGGNGFVASFVAGLVFGWVSRHEIANATEYTESTGLFMSYGVWALFGAVLVGPMLEHGWDWRAIGYALASLTVIRMFPVAISLLGSDIGTAGMVFIGWFGPRGLASVVFLILAADDLHLTREHVGNIVVQTIVWTILLSVVLHGFSAGPLSRWFAGTEAQQRPRVGPTAVAVDAPPRRRRLGLVHHPTEGDSDPPR